jgi:putative ABC transport system permease protein
MGRLRLICRLAARDLRRRRTEAILLLLVFTAATTTLALGLALNGVTNQPYLQTRGATAGPDVVLNLNPNGSAPATRTGLAQLAALEHASGVTGHTGPYPATWAALEANGHAAGAQVEGRETAPASIDQPKVTQGSWIQGNGTAVLERTFAQALGAHAGDRVTLNGRPFRVVGIAVSAAVPPYPRVCDDGCETSTSGQAGAQTGQVWVTEADARSLARPGDPLYYFVNLKLADPNQASAFASAHSGNPSQIGWNTWQSISWLDGKMILSEQRAMIIFSWLLGILAIASVAVLVGGRMADQTRRVGLLKAAGGTPGLVAVVLAAEYVVIALAATAAGLLIGWAVAPLLTRPGAGLLGTGPSPGLSLASIAVVTIVALLVAMLGTFVPAVRAARITAIGALAAPVRPPKHRARLTALSARLPVPMLLGLRIAGRRPRRTALSVASIAVTAGSIIAVLAVARQGRLSFQGRGGGSGLANPIADQLGQLLLVVTAMLAILAAINVIFITWASVHDVRLSSGLARALGATPEQVTAGLVSAQVLPALAGAVLGIPLGTGLSVALQHNASVMYPPVAGVLAVLLGTVVAVVALATPAAHVSNHHPIAQALQDEALAGIELCDRGTTGAAVIPASWAAFPANALSRWPSPG